MLRIKLLMVSLETSNSFSLTPQTPHPGRGTRSTQENKGSTQENKGSTQENKGSTQEIILDEIRRHPSTTRNELAVLAGISSDGIKKQLDKLKQARKIKHVGPTKGGYWEIITEQVSKEDKA